ncbi:MAG: phage portal protein [Bacteroidia bacterium]|nr:phage portal protein [Bacteroidia bacterium]
MPEIIAPSGLPARRSLAVSALRDYAAGATAGPNQNFRPRPRSADFDIRRAVANIVGRCRDQAKNNPSISGAIKRIVNNVVRFGIRPQFQFRSDGRIDIAANRAWEALFSRWARYADLTGKKSYWKMQRLGLAQVWPDGGFFLHRTWSKKSIPGVPDLRIEMLERDHLDRTVDGTLPNGNQARGGREFDDDGQVIAYHLFRNHPGDYQAGRSGLHSERIPASEIIDVWDQDWISQTMPVPWLAAVVIEAYNLAEFRDYSMIAAKLETAFGMFIKSNYPDLGHPGLGLQQVPGQAAASEWPTTWADMPDYIEPGRIQSIPFGTDIVFPSNTRPGPQYEPFVRESRRQQAVGLGMSYEAYAADYTAASYSSARSGSLEERLSYQGMQFFLDEEMNQKVAAWFIEAAWLAGLNPTPMPGFRFDPYPYLEAVTPQNPGWSWVDPYKDGQASELKIKNALSNHRREAAGQGIDFDENLDELIAIEQRLLELDQIRAERAKLQNPIQGAPSNGPTE